MTTKVCTKCGVEKPLGEYFRDKSKKDGVSSSCKDCYKQYCKANKEVKSEYYKRNKKKINDRTRKWQRNNREKVNDIAKVYRLNNPEKVKEYNRLYMLNNPEKVKQASQKWKINNREKNKETTQTWRANNPEKVKEQRVRNRNRLIPSYVKLLIRREYNITTADITPETIEMKRRSLKYYRELNQLKKITK